MPKNILFGLFFAIAASGSMTALAQSGGFSSSRAEARWEGLSDNERAMVDRIAADFYQSDLRLAQSRQIEASTSAIYASLSDKEREQFREERRSDWKAMQQEERAALRNVKLPAYSNLTEAQKAPFRQIALDRLAPKPAPVETPKSSAGTGTDI
ncbi:MAG: hypothetical protein AAF936_02570 [Pseudomonadota bacterium]